jgi:hypothetical protein
MHDLTGVYPEDIYSFEGARLYGDQGGGGEDRLSVGLMQRCRGRPNALVKIYRAVPKALTREDRIQEIETQKRYVQKYGKFPRDVDLRGMDRHKFYDQISDELEKLQAQPPSAPAEKRVIHPGDWVSISRNYAKQHGISALNGQYQILTKTVKAKDLFTNGDSLHEWGYSPA